VRGEATADLEKRAANAKKTAAKALASSIDDALPTEAAGDQWWIDPIVGLRGQVNLTRWLFLATQADVGGFGAGSQIAWNVQATLGFNLTRNVFAELGYRYMYVDYQNSGFLYQMNSYGIFTGVGVKF
jgi:opacity protein-like surface antigen